MYGKSQDNYLIFNYPLSYVYKISIITLCKLLIRLLFYTNILYHRYLTVYFREGLHRLSLLPNLFEFQ